MRSILTTLAFAAAAASAAPAFAADRRVPQEYATIQEAVDAASSGDRILVSRGTYNENVVATGKDGLRFQARGKVVWDGNVDGIAGTCLQVFGSGTVVERFDFRNGVFQVELYGDGVRIARCASRSALARAFTVFGPAVPAFNPSVNSRIEACVVRGANGAVFASLSGGGVSKLVVTGCLTGVNLFGDGATIERSSFSGCSQDAVDASGDGIRVTKNRMRRTAGIRVAGTGVEVSRNSVQHALLRGIVAFGDDLRIEANSVSSVSGEGIRATGARLTVAANRVTGTSGAAIHVAMNSASIRANRVSFSGLEGIVVRDSDGMSDRAAPRGASAPLTLEDNQVSDTNGAGIDVNTFTSNCTLRRNRALRCGAGCTSAILVRSLGARLEDCASTDAGGDGFVVAGKMGGEAVTLSRCSAQRSGRSGIVVGFGVTAAIERCRSIGNAGDGLVHFGTNSTMSGCTLRDNRTDLIETGTFASPPDERQYRTSQQFTEIACDA